MADGKNTIFMTLFLHIDRGADARFREFALLFYLSVVIAFLFLYPGDTSSSASQVWLASQADFVFLLGSIFICIVHYYGSGTCLHLWYFVFIDRQSRDGMIIIL